MGSIGGIREVLNQSFNARLFRITVTAVQRITFAMMRQVLFMSINPYQIF